MDLFGCCGGSEQGAKAVSKAAEEQRGERVAEASALSKEGDRVHVKVSQPAPHAACPAALAEAGPRLYKDRERAAWVPRAVVFAASGAPHHLLATHGSTRCKSQHTWSSAQVQGRFISVIREKGVLHAIDSICYHAGGALVRACSWMHVPVVHRICRTCGRKGRGHRGRARARRGWAT